MGTSEDGDECGGVVDCLVGTIVWVRRRNGSWWPGRIVGPEELSASHLMSPRSGTPVKLLGREDASVDWYNLEKSKRVKAFRCGDFDACIERAEASQGTPIRKREKYARREDAILHALELEKKQLAMKHQKQGLTSDGVASMLSSSPRKELNNFTSFCSGNEETIVHNELSGCKSPTLFVKGALSKEEKVLDDIVHLHQGSSNEWEDENAPEAIPGIRGLPHFDLQVPSKRKFCPSIAWETFRSPVAKQLEDFSPSGCALGGASQRGGGNKITLTAKRKRSQNSMLEDSLIKRCDRRRPLLQVLQNSAKLPASSSFQPDESVAATLSGGKDPIDVVYRAKRSQCIYLPGDLDYFVDEGDFPSEQTHRTRADFEMENYLQHPVSLADGYTSSGLNDKNGSDSSESECTETDTDDEAELLRDANQTLGPESNPCVPSPFQASEKFRNLEKDEMPLSSYACRTSSQEDPPGGSAELGVSHWHIKGKRNIRNIVKRPVDMINGKVLLDKCNDSKRGSTHQSKGSTGRQEMIEISGQRPSGHGCYQIKEEFGYDYHEAEMIANDFRYKGMSRYGVQRYPGLLKVTGDQGTGRISVNHPGMDSCNLSSSSCETDGQPHIARKAYWDEYASYRQDYAAYLGGEAGSMLVDVDLKVQASYQGEHVPLVSLMSRLNGKAIVGHPVQIEVLEDGSSAQFLLGNDTGLDENAAPPCVWRTGRRTAMQRIPRSNPAITTLESYDDGSLLYTEQQLKCPIKKNPSHFNHRASLAKGISQARHPTSAKLQKRPSKRVSLPSPKIRTLSSIATENKICGDNSDAKLVSGSDIFGGLIKQGAAVHLVTCVPMKVVFSRILVAVGRPSSAVAHRVGMASPGVSDPS